MKVRAIFPGYYNHERRGVGKRKDEAFVLTDPKHFSKKWMVEVKDGAPAPAPAAPAEKVAGGKKAAKEVI